MLFHPLCFFVVWQHAEAKSTRLYELKQQLVQTSLNLFNDQPTSGHIPDRNLYPYMGCVFQR